MQVLGISLLSLVTGLLVSSSMFTTDRRANEQHSKEGRSARSDTQVAGRKPVLCLFLGVAVGAGLATCAAWLRISGSPGNESVRAGARSAQTPCTAQSPAISEPVLAEKHNPEKEASAAAAGIAEPPCSTSQYTNGTWHLGISRDGRTTTCGLKTRYSQDIFKLSRIPGTKSTLPDAILPWSQWCWKPRECSLAPFSRARSCRILAKRTAQRKAATGANSVTTVLFVGDSITYMMYEARL